MKRLEQLIKLYPIPTQVEELIEQMMVHQHNLEADTKKAFKSGKMVQGDDYRLYIKRWACMTSAIRSMEQLIKLSK